MYKPHPHKKKKKKLDLHGKWMLLSVSNKKPCNSLLSKWLEVGIMDGHTVDQQSTLASFRHDGDLYTTLTTSARFVTVFTVGV